ncbi:DUF2934 domain-containing protein [Methylobacterium sp. C25]|uniref:DUF2934 domain-containing protein n=1 Tax=Methylobacterium sp. C25 TaxID=2721622 RepID=UPI002D7F3603|nr:DUF2934 domain-containing protein [Methylobacterium sp. C25]
MLVERIRSREARAIATTRQAITRERIRERAYELWERNHRPEGLDMQFWLVAERELRAELEKRGQLPEGERASDDAVAASGDAPRNKP